MRQVIVALLIGIFTFSFFMMDAEAKRFGGGKSFGMSRQSSSFSRTAQPAPHAPAAAAKPASGASKWLGPLAGLAVGGLLASLFMGHGLGTGILSWLLIGGLLFLVWSFIRNRLQPAPQVQSNTHNNAHYQVQQQPHLAQPTNPIFSSAANSAKKEPVADFDEAGFLRNAKSLFIRLQAAYDNKNLSDIREYTSPEIFAEIQLQLQERGDAVNQTEVVKIDAELMDLAVEPHMTIASVQFNGQVREEVGAEPTNIKEIWHFQKFEVRPNWVIAGIQQA